MNKKTFLKLIAIGVLISPAIFDIAKWKSYENFYAQNKKENIEKSISLKADNRWLYLDSPKGLARNVGWHWPALAAADKYEINLATPRLLFSNLCARMEHISLMAGLKIDNGLDIKHEGAMFPRAWGMSECWWIEGTPDYVHLPGIAITKYIYALPFFDLIPFSWIIIYPLFLLALFIILIVSIMLYLLD